MGRKETPILDARAAGGPPPPSIPSTYGREIRSIALFAAALLTTLALLSYHPYDPSPFVEGTISKAPRNLVGYLGSYFAGTAFDLLGLVAFWIPMLLARLGVVSLLGEGILKPGRLLIWVSLFMSQSALFQWLLPSQSLVIHGEKTSVPMNMGGDMGIVVGRLLDYFVGDTGASVLLPLWVLVTLMFLWQLSVRQLAAACAGPARTLWQRWKVSRERHRLEEEREEAREQVRQKQAERVQMEEQRKAATPARPLPHASGAVSRTPGLPLDPAPVRPGYGIPPTDLLDPPKPLPPLNRAVLQETARLIESRLLEFGVEGQVVEIQPGPVVTIFQYKTAPGIKYNRVISYADDLALTLKSDHIRMDRVGGTSHVGIEVPNADREIIAFREIVESPEFRSLPGRLPLALGKGVNGKPFTATLDQMPHLLVAGTTGSGKSVGINVLLHSILFRSGPGEVKLILIDPKQVELKVYEGLPHLKVPVITDVKKAANALNWAVREMQERYKTLAGCKVRTIEQYNEYVRSLTPQSAEGAGIDRPLPHIVIVIDELYDLMAAAAKEVETSIARLSAMARAVGIHLILATQRPSRDVITGVIKSNMPARIAFQVREKLESRLILDQNGAEALGGKGDMLFLPPGTGRVTRIHGAFLSTVETQKVLQYIERAGKPQYDMDILKDQPGGTGSAPGSEEGDGGDSDPLYAEAMKLVVRTGVASASNLQRRMRIGYARAARILDIMEKNGVVGPADGAKPREIFATPDEAGE